MKITDFQQAVDYAIVREKEASALYTRMGYLAENPQARQFFLDMAGEEEQHERMLRDIGSRGEAEFIELSNPPDDAVVECFKPLTSLDEMSYMDALLFAAQRETDTAEYYKHMSGIVTNGAADSFFKSLSSWELVHKAKVEAEYERNFAPKGTADL